jgi:uncharacterized protein YqeY
MRAEIDAALKTAMKAGDKRRVGTLRMMNAAIKDRDIAGRTSGASLTSDDELLTLFAKMIKQREESAKLYDDAGRAELAAQEREEIEIIRAYMPRQLADDDIRATAAAIVAELGATSVKDLGKVMAALKERYAGQMDFSKASQIAKGLLG